MIKTNSLRLTNRQIRRARKADKARRKAAEAKAAKFRADLEAWGERMPEWQRELLKPKG